MRIHKLKIDSNIQDIMKDVYERHYMYLDSKKINPEQILSKVFNVIFVQNQQRNYKRLVKIIKIKRLVTVNLKIKKEKKLQIKSQKKKMKMTYMILKMLIMILSI